MDGITIRPLFGPDLTNGFVETLARLAPVNLDYEGLVRAFQARIRASVRTLVALHDKEVVGTASYFIEPKFIHAGGKVIHIEDVAVHPQWERKGIGRLLMDHIELVGREAGCYKSILDCGEHNVVFYEKLGYQRHGAQMRKNLT